MSTHQHRHPVHWYILGPGAIGCLWASYWSAEGRPVTLISRTTTKTKLLQLSTQDGKEQWPVDVITANQLSSPIHYLLITTKAQQTKEALATIQHQLSATAVIVVLQNGIVANQLGFASGQRLIAATTTDGAFRKAPMHVVHAGRGKTFIGEMDPTTRDSETQALVQLLPRRLQIHPCHNIEERLRQKLAINCAINALTVIYQCPNGELLTRKDARAELTLICSEISQLAAGLHWGPWFEHLESHVIKVLEMTASNINSMLQDIRAGRSTEIAQLNGYLCEQAQNYHLPCPHNQKLLDTIQSIDVDKHNMLQ